MNTGCRPCSATETARIRLAVPDPDGRVWNSTLKRGRGLNRGGALKRRKPLNPVSGKTAARNREYRAGRDAHLAANPWCVFPLPGGGWCGRRASDCHHREPRGIAPDRVTDPDNFASLCREHHRVITDRPWVGYDSGLLERSSYEIRQRASAPPMRGDE